MTTDYRKMNAGDMLDAMGDDAKKWAQAFLQINPNCGLDEATMISWFANAIEHSSDLRIPDRAPIRLDDGSAFFVGQA